MREFVRRNAVLLFATLTPLLTFATLLLPLPREVLPMLIVFIPTALAAILTALEGESVGALFAQLNPKRISLKWALIALGVGLALRIGVLGIGLLLGAAEDFGLDTFTPVLVIVFLFAAAEEIGWRGYALPRLLRTQSPLAASLILGVPWAALHLALFFPGMMFEGLPAVAVMIVMLSLSVLTAWVYVGAGRGGVIAATLLHASQNFFVFLSNGIEPALGNWLMAVVFVLAAVLIAVLDRRMWGVARMTSTPITPAGEARTP